MQTNKADVCIGCDSKNNIIHSVKLCNNCFIKRENELGIFKNHQYVYRCSKCQCLKNCNGNWITISNPEMLRILLYKLIKDIDHFTIVDYNLGTENENSYSLNVIYKRLLSDYTQKYENSENYIKITKNVIFTALDDERCNKCSDVKIQPNVYIHFYQKFKRPFTLLSFEQVILKYYKINLIHEIFMIKSDICATFLKKEDALQFISFLSHRFVINSGNAKKSTISDIGLEYNVEIVSLQINDICLLSKNRSQKFGGIGQICLVKMVTDAIHLVNPFNGNERVVQSRQYFQDPFFSLSVERELEEFMVTEKLYEETKRHNMQQAGDVGLMSLSNMEKELFLRSHLWQYLEENDTVKGLDLSCVNVADGILDELTQDDNLPNVVLVEKVEDTPKSTRLLNRLSDKSDKFKFPEFDDSVTEKFKILIDSDKKLEWFIN